MAQEEMQIRNLMEVVETKSGQVTWINSLVSSPIVIWSCLVSRVSISTCQSVSSGHIADRDRLRAQL